MTTASDDAAKPVPVRVVLSADPVLGHPEQEVVARLWRRRQTGTGAAEYRGWARAPDHVRPVDGVDYDQVATEPLEPSPQSAVREVLGERRPPGWVLRLHVAQAQERQSRRAVLTLQLQSGHPNRDLVEVHMRVRAY